MPIANITVVHVNTQRVGIPFTVRGHLHLDDHISTSDVEFSDGVQTARLANATVTSGVSEYSFVHPGYAAPGNFTLTISTLTGVSVASNPFDVVVEEAK